jgi:hypothetical protein
LDRIIEHIPVQVRIAGGERQRVLAQETTGLRIVPAGTVVLETDLDAALSHQENLGFIAIQTLRTDNTIAEGVGVYTLSQARAADTRSAR